MNQTTARLAVYLVEDSPVMANLLRRLLSEERDVQIVGSADNAASAILDIATLRPQLVVIDLALKSGSGYDVLKALPGRNGSRPTAVVLTNLSADVHRSRACELGADQFFDKSRDIGLMLAYVRDFARRRAAS